jgi:hypothetical protein
VREDDDRVELPDGFVEVPIGSGWFGYTNLLTSAERRGLEPDAYHAKLDEQNGACAICGREPPSVGPLVIDHDHANDQVRGLLCRRCNLGIENFYEDPRVLESAARYIEQHGSWVTRVEEPPDNYLWNAPIPGAPD